MRPSDDVTRILQDWEQGRPGALEELSGLMYHELRRQAARQLRRERSDHTLQPTALVHEVFLRLFGETAPALNDRAHFLAVAVRVMRRVLIEHARARGASKRGGGLARLTLDDRLPAPELDLVEIVALNEAMERLEQLDERQARIVEMRYFIGLSIEETAETIGVSPATVKNEMALAKAWLRREIARVGVPE